MSYSAYESYSYLVVDFLTRELNLGSFLRETKTKFTNAHDNIHNSDGSLTHKKTNQKNFISFVLEKNYEELF